MTELTKETIKKYKDLINNNKWEILYLEIVYYPSYGIGDFTQTLLDAGINPLELGLDGIPYDFLYGSTIKQFYIPTHIKYIGDNAFRYCKNLEFVSIPNTIKRIGIGAFGNCPLLKNIKYRGTVKEWESIDKHIDWGYNTDIHSIYCDDETITY